MRYLGMLAAVGLILAVVATAQAVTVNYTVFDWGPTSYPGPNPPPAGAPHASYPGDTVKLVGYTGTIDLVLGAAPKSAKIGTLQWTVDWTYNGTDNDLSNDGAPPKDWPELQFTINAAPTMSTVGGTSGTLNQTGRLRTNWDWDYLRWDGGPLTSFLVWDGGNQYRIDVTPLLLAEVKMNYWSGSPPWVQTARQVNANFTATLVPEPVTMAGLFLGLGGLATYVRKRRIA